MLVSVLNIHHNHIGGNGDFPEWAFGSCPILVPFLQFRVIILLADEGVLL